MSDTSTGDHHNPGRYEIRLKGLLAPRWAAWFDGLSLAYRSDGTTIIHGFVADQAALHGLLRKCAISACRWSRSLRSNPTNPTYPPHLDRCSPIPARRTT
jgi:hypothetical protein